MDSMNHMLHDSGDPESMMEMMGLDISSITHVDYGASRGAHPQRTDAQIKAVEKLASRITLKTEKKPKDEDEAHVVEDFDILSQPRVILFQGKVIKKSLNSMVTHHTPKRLILFNDCILLCNPHNSYLSTTEMLSINFVVPLEEVQFIPYLTTSTSTNMGGSNNTNNTNDTNDNVPMEMNDQESQQGFEIRTNDRPFHFIAENDSDKRIWCEEIEMAIKAYISTPGLNLLPGWQHHAIQGTLFSSIVLKQSIDVVKNHINNLISTRKDIDDVDDYCMTALHWAALIGNCVHCQKLINSGADIDALNNGLNSPLLLAAASGHAEVFIFLVEQGANIFLRNLKDRDPLFLIVMYAHSNKSVQVMLDILLSRGVELDTCDNTGGAPIHLAATLGLPHAIDMLTSAGADINQPHEMTGLTPLQLCVSRDGADPETVRSLLERGAYANALAPNRLNSMDLVMNAFASKHDLDFRLHTIGDHDSNSNSSSSGVGVRVGVGGGSNNVGISNSNGSGIYHKFEMDMDTVQEFAMSTLPLLMEIAKRGGRYSDDTLAPLRSSFIEAVKSARQQWLDSSCDIKDFTKYVKLDNIIKGHPKYHNDNSSQHCLLCIEKFTMYNRRHHCRNCGILCCEPCSTKKLPSSSDNSSSGGNGGKADMQRVCDSCYNKLLHSYACRKTDYNVAEKEKRLAKEKRDLEKAAYANANAKAAGDSGTSTIGSLFSWGSETGSPRDAAEEAMNALNKRGEQLQSVANKAADMNDAASEFNRATKQLLKQQQQSSIWR